MSVVGANFMEENIAYIQINYTNLAQYDLIYHDLCINLANGHQLEGLG
jgi:hypothetical protein